MGVVNAVTYQCELCEIQETGPENKTPRTSWGGGAWLKWGRAKFLCDKCVTYVIWKHQEQNKKPLKTADGVDVFERMTLYVYNSKVFAGKLFMQDGKPAVRLINEYGISEGWAPLSDCYSDKQKHDRAQSEQKEKCSGS